MIKFVGIVLLKFLIVFIILAILVHVSLWIAHKLLLTENDLSMLNNAKLNDKLGDLPKLKETLESALKQKLTAQDQINEQNYNYAKYIEWDELDRKSVLEPMKPVTQSTETNIRNYREGILAPQLEDHRDPDFQGQAPVIPEAFMPITLTTGVFPANDMPYNDDSTPFVELATKRIAQLQALDNSTEFDEYDKAHLEYSNNMAYRKEKLDANKPLAEADTLDFSDRNVITDKFEKPLSYGPYF
jgi:hypothetical protein